MALRGYEETSEFAGLVDYTGDTDSQAPQLAGLFADNRTPIFVKSYQVHHWDWDNNQPGALISDWPVTLSALQSTSQETLHLPDREGGDIYQGRWLFRNLLPKRRCDRKKCLNLSFRGNEESLPAK